MTDRYSRLRWGSIDTEPPAREPGRRDWSSVVCFSCGRPDHAASQCPALDVVFPFLATGMVGGKGGMQFFLSCSHPGCWPSDSGRKTATDPWRGGGGG